MLDESEPHDNEDKAEDNDDKCDDEKCSEYFVFLAKNVCPLGAWIWFSRRRIYDIIVTAAVHAKLVLIK